VATLCGGACSARAATANVLRRRRLAEASASEPGTREKNRDIMTPRHDGVGADNCGFTEYDLLIKT
jgi:hypothetical protein